jgi:hypothetical protein
LRPVLKNERSVGREDEGVALWGKPKAQRYGMACHRLEHVSRKCKGGRKAREPGYKGTFEPG